MSFYVEFSVSKTDEEKKPMAWTVYAAGRAHLLIGWVDFNPETKKFEFAWNSRAGLLEPGSQDEIEQFVAEMNAARGARRAAKKEAEGFSFPAEGIRL